MPLVLQLGVNRHFNLAKVDSGHCAVGFPKALRVPVWSLGWGQHARHECPLARVISKVPEGNLYRQQAAYTTKEAAVCSHCTLGPHGEKSTVGLTGCKGKAFLRIHQI